MKQILFATTNPHKKERFQAYFKPLGLKVLSLADLNIHLKVEEDGKTPEENATKKAMAYYKIAKIPTFAVDYGLYIDKFPPEKQPGLFVRRIYGDSREVTDEEMLTYYICELEKVGGKSGGKWVSAISLVVDGKVYSQSFSGKTMLTSKRSSSAVTIGEPLNSLQIDPRSGKYFTDLTMDEWVTLQSEREKGYIKFMKRCLEKF